METFLDILMHYGLYAVALAGMTLSFLCSAVETGSYRLNRVRLKIQADAGDGRARTLLRLLADMRGLIVTILISNNVGNFATTAAITTLVAAAAVGRSDVAVQLIATAIVTPLLFVFCELLPKNVFAFEPEGRMLVLARPVRAAYLVMRWTGLAPLLKGFSRLVLRAARRAEGAEADPFTPRQRLRALFRESAAEGVISGYQGEIVEKVLALREQPVRKVMIPMNHVAGAVVHGGREHFLKELRRHSFSRLPVYEGQRENVVGIVRVNDVLAAEPEAFNLAALMSRDIVALAPETTVSQAIFRLRKARAAMAVVRDERGRAVGIVTIKDLVEEIVGELGAW